MSFGLGRHVWDIEYKKLTQLFLFLYISNIVHGVAMACSKTVLSLMMWRVVAGKVWIRYCLVFVIVSVWISAFVSSISPFLRCTPVQKNWEFFMPGKCTGLRFGYATIRFKYGMKLLHILPLFGRHILTHLSLYTCYWEQSGSASLISSSRFFHGFLFLH